MHHERDELTCPRCGTVLEGDFGTVDVATGDEQIRTAIECPDCDAPLTVVIESALPDALGVDVWIEDRRDKS
jgi:hypothetical protein